MMTWDKWKLEPQTDEEKRECETVEGMRRRINRYRRESVLTRAVFDAAHYRGLSGEDTMTWLAFEALRLVERYERLILDDALLKPASPIVLMAPPGSPIGKSSR